MDEIIDTSKTYHFTSAFSGPGMVLSVSKPDNGTGSILTMANATDARDDGQWFLTRVNGDQPGIFYRLHVVSKGVAQSLDVINQGGAVTSTRLKMAPSGDSSGQAWRFNRWSDKESDGFRLSNKLTMPDLHLDIFRNSLDAHLFGGDFSGQHWTLASVSGASRDQQDGDGGADTDGHLLSRAGAIGLAVVGGLGFSLLIFGLIYWVVKSRYRKRRNQRHPAELSPETMMRKPSVSSMVTEHSYSLYQLQTQPAQTQSMINNPDVDTVSPASIYSQGTLGLARSSIGVVGGVSPIAGAGQTRSSLLVELPDRKYA